MYCCCWEKIKNRSTRISLKGEKGDDKINCELFKEQRQSSEKIEIEREKKD
jgi:hypothetical protein